MASLEAVLEPSTAAYRRQARRLRSVHANRPGRLQAALRELSARHDARRREPAADAIVTGGIIRPARETIPAAGGSEEFAAEVLRRMDGPVLRYSQRRALLASAGRRGIGRFQANLIIAAVQHERGGTGVPSGTGSGGTTTAWAALAVIAVTQAAAILGAWRVWHP